MVDKEEPVTELLDELAPPEVVEGADVAAWIDRAAQLLKTIAPALDGDLRVEANSLLSDLGESYFIEEGAGAVDEQTTDEAPVAEADGDTVDDRLAYSLAALDIFLAHSGATGEAQNAMTSLIETYRQSLPGEKVAAAAKWALDFEQAAWPAG